MELTPCKTIHGFTVRTTSDLPEIDGRAYVLDHNASRAQLLYLQNDDTNKAFSIASRHRPRTTRASSTSSSTRCCAAPASSP